MKILFIYPNFMRQENISLGIAYLSAYVKLHGHTTDLVDYTWGGTTRTALKAIERCKPQIVAFSTRTGEFTRSLKIAQAIKKRYGNEIHILFGGVHPTVAPEDAIINDVIDSICIGEGEQPLVELCNKLEEGKDIATVKGIWTRRNNKIIKNEVASPIDDLDRIPFPDRELFDIQRYIDSRNGGVDLMSSRGCPFDCSYCINAYLHSLYKEKGRLVRKRSVQNVIDEIGFLKNTYNIKRIFFHDDLFTTPLKWMEEFSKALPKSYNLTYSCSTRAEMVSPALCIYLKDSGCTNICIGIESGSEKIRREVLKRNVSNDFIKRAFSMCKDAGLATYSYNIVGIPYETPQEIQETIRLNQEVKPTFLQVSIFQPYPGTALYGMCLEKRWLDKNVLPYSHQFCSLLKYPQISSMRIYWEKVTFRFRVLRKESLKKALFVLLYDCCFVYVTKIRQCIPPSMKTFANRVLEVFLSK
ncbi:B12-binding domain-containing radical SAM protein [Candidatus Omnitrophota bacterium]